MNRSYRLVIFRIRYRQRKSYEMALGIREAVQKATEILKRLV
jgi:hypothetical protein